jgi:hypothetical protein
MQDLTSSATQPGHLHQLTPVEAGGTRRTKVLCRGYGTNKGRRLGPAHAGGSVPWQELQLRDASVISEVVRDIFTRSGEVRRLEVRRDQARRRRADLGDSNVSEDTQPRRFFSVIRLGAEGRRHSDR